MRQRPQAARTSTSTSAAAAAAWRHLAGFKGELYLAGELVDLVLESSQRAENGFERRHHALVGRWCATVAAFNLAEQHCCLLLSQLSHRTSLWSLLVLVGTETEMCLLVNTILAGTRV